jgi:peptide/nickel transport system substrate-binding protein/oligopeptide transport system substrate-binding protein
LPLNVFDRLVEAVTTAPGKSELVPGLAEKWDVSGDGLTYTFSLRKIVKFHNGATFTADDVVYTFDRMLNPATEALNTDFLDMIKGAQERLDGKAPTTAGLKKVDDDTVQITLAAPFAPFLANLATPAAPVLSERLASLSRTLNLQCRQLKHQVSGNGMIHLSKPSIVSTTIS